MIVHKPYLCYCALFPCLGVGFASGYPVFMLMLPRPSLVRLCTSTVTYVTTTVHVIVNDIDEPLDRAHSYLDLRASNHSHTAVKLTSLVHAARLPSMLWRMIRGICPHSFRFQICLRRGWKTPIDLAGAVLAVLNWPAQRGDSS